MLLCLFLITSLFLSSFPSLISRTVDHSGPLFLISSLFLLRSSGTVDHSGPLFLLLLPFLLSGFQEQLIIPVHSSCYPPLLLESLNSRSFRSTLQDSLSSSLSLSFLTISYTIVCHSGPLSCFTNLSISSRKSTVSHQSFTFLTDTNNFYPQSLLTIFTHDIFTDFHRSSQIFTSLSCHSASIYSFLFTRHPVSKIFTDLPQIFQRSFKNFPSSIPFHLVPGQSVIPAHSPVFHRSSRIFTGLSCHSASIYPFFTRHPVSKIFTDLPQIFQRSFKNFPSSIPFHLVPGQSVIPAHSPVFQVSPFFLVYLPYPHSSSQIFNRSSKKFIFLCSSFIPYFLVSGQSVIPAHSPDLQVCSPSPSISSLIPIHFFTDLSQIFQEVFLPPSLTTLFLDSRSFRPTLQPPCPFFVCPLFPHSPSSIFYRSFLLSSLSIPYTLVSGQPVILPIFPRWRIHTNLLTKLP